MTNPTASSPPSPSAKELIVRVEKGGMRTGATKLNMKLTAKESNTRIGTGTRALPRNGVKTKIPLQRANRNKNEQSRSIETSKPLIGYKSRSWRIAGL